ncbi:DUF4926 domain-containing protein [candidate division KSB1 bacterium]|nr:DUF4926 domain-containing protein [candidate division KSB1 bacterium]
MKTETKKFALFQRVALTRDFPKLNLREGDLATIVDHHPAPPGQDDGYSLEVFNAIGETIAVIVVNESDIQALRPDEVLNARAWAAAA